MRNNLARIALVGTVSLFAPGLAAQDHAPLPERLIAARTIYLINDSGDLKAYDAFFRELTKWRRFKVVASRDTVDVVAVLTSKLKGDTAEISIKGGN
jgi:hypothetical protein